MVCMLYLHDKRMSLHQYCKDNHYDYLTIRKYVVDGGLKLDAAISKYLKNHGRKDAKAVYYVDDITLIEYCRQHNYCYGAIRYQIVKYCLPVIDAIEKYKQFKERQNAKRTKKN